MNKYKLGEVVYYMCENIPHSAPILALMIVQNAHEDWASTDIQKDIFTPFGMSRVIYATCHGMINESDCYATLSELLNRNVN